MVGPLVPIPAQSPPTAYSMIDIVFRRLHNPAASPFQHRPLGPGLFGSRLLFELRSQQSML